MVISIVMFYQRLVSMVVGQIQWIIPSPPLFPPSISSSKTSPGSSWLLAKNHLTVVKNAPWLDRKTTVKWQTNPQKMWVTKEVLFTKRVLLIWLCLNIVTFQVLQNYIPCWGGFIERFFGFSDLTLTVAKVNVLTRQYLFQKNSASQQWVGYQPIPTWCRFMALGFTTLLAFQNAALLLRNRNHTHTHTLSRSLFLHRHLWETIFHSYI